MVRDLFRTNALLSGIPTFVGPDTEQGGYLLGGFFYLLSLPSVYFGSTNPIIFTNYTLILRSVSLIYSSVKLSKISNIPKSIIFLYLAILVPFSFSPYSNWINNSSFIPIAFPFLIYSFFSYYKTCHEKDAFKLLFASILIGLSAQLHLTFFYFGILLFICIFSKHKTISFKNFIIVISGLMLTSFSYIISIINFKLGSYFDGPSFTNLDTQILKQLNRIFSFNPTIDLFKLNSKDLFFNLQYLLIYSYLLLKVFISYKNLKKIVLYIILLNIFIGLINFSFFINSTVLRYQYVGLYLGALILFFDLTKYFKIKNVIYLNIIFILFYVTFKFNFFFNADTKTIYSENKFSMKEYIGVCDFFNNQKISFEDFSKNTFEISPNLNLNNFNSSEFCFNEIKSKNIKLNKNYLIVYFQAWDSKNNNFKMKINLPFEISENIKKNSFKTEYATDKFFIISYEPVYKKSTKDIYSNISYMYEVDPGLPLMSQLNSLLIKYQFNTLIKTDFHKIKLCETSVFCDVYVIYQYENEELKIILLSRILQVLEALKPYSANLKDLRAHGTCNGLPVEFNLASNLGFAFDIAKNNIKIEEEQSLRTPLLIHKKMSCDTFKLHKLSASTETFINMLDYEVKYNTTYPLLDLK